MSRGRKKVLREIEGRTMNNDEAAAYIGCTSGTLRVWTSKRRVPFVKVGRLTRFRKSDLDAWLQKNVVDVLS
jgi:excisionase family DNA binding protein